MEQELNLSSKEHIKHNVSKYLLRFFQNRELQPQIMPAECRILQNTVFLMLQIEVALWQLAQSNYQALEALWSLNCEPNAKSKTLAELQDITNNSPWPMSYTESQHVKVFAKDMWNIFRAPLLNQYCVHSQQGYLQILPILARKFGITYEGIDVLPNNVSGSIKMLPFDVRNLQGARQALFYECNLGRFSFTVPQIGKDKTFCTGKMPLFNLDLLERNQTAAVFIVNSIPLASRLQEKANQFTLDFDIKNINDRIELFSQKIEKNEKKRYLEIQHGSQYRDQEFSISDYIVSIQRDNNENIAKLKKLANELHNLMKISFNRQVTTTTETVFTACYGTDEIQSLRRTDLAPLTQHSIFYVYSGQFGDKGKIQHCLDILAEFSSIEYPQMYFVHVPDIIDSVNYENGGLTIDSSLEVFSQALDLGLDLKKVAQSEAARAFALNRKTKSESFLIDNILDRQSILLISADTGVGKSIFAQNLGYALATKGALINGWKVNEHCKVLYVCDSELDERTFQKHKEKFRKLYNFSPDKCDFIYEKAENLDLMKSDDERQKLRNKINEYQYSQGTRGMPVSVIILDSLNRLAPGSHLEPNWVIFSVWLTSLLQDGLAIILVHHTSKDARSDYYGTSKIKNDADVHIYLDSDETRNQTDCIQINMWQKKNRRSWLDRSKKTLTLFWGKNPQWQDDEFNVLKWRGMPEQEKINKISELRKDFTSKQIAARFNVSYKTIEKFVQEHSAIPKLKCINKKINQSSSEKFVSSDKT